MREIFYLLDVRLRTSHESLMNVPFRLSDRNVFHHHFPANIPFHNINSMRINVEVEITIFSKGIEKEETVATFF